MAKIYYESDASLAELESQVVGLIGYGNQGRAHALNLRDSGISVQVGSRENSSSAQTAQEEGFGKRSIEQVAANCDVIALMLPDEVMQKTYVGSIEPYLTSHKTFVFAHGFVVHHKVLHLPSDADVVLVAPTGPGRQLRSLYKEGLGLPALVAVEQDGSGRAFEKALAYARGIGCTRAGVIQTTFAEETVTDLFCEQAVLCGGLPELIKTSFETLVAAGYQPELAYISCLKEVKLIADLLFERGLVGMRDAISNTAKYGSAVAGPRIIDAKTRQSLHELLTEIEDGRFASAFLGDKDGEKLSTFRDHERNSKLARTGRELQESLKF